MKKKMIILMLIIAGLIVAGLIAFVFLNKCKKEECKPCNTPTEIISTDQEKALEQMFLNNEISEYPNQKVNEHEYKIEKVSCKAIKQDDMGRYIMRCYLSQTATDFSNNQKFELINFPVIVGYMETLTGGKYITANSPWFGDSILKDICWNQNKESGLKCIDEDGTE